MCSLWICEGVVDNFVDKLWISLMYDWKPLIPTLSPSLPTLFHSALLTSCYAKLIIKITVT